MATPPSLNHLNLLWKGLFKSPNSCLQFVIVHVLDCGHAGCPSRSECPSTLFATVMRLDGAFKCIFETRSYTEANLWSWYSKVNKHIRKTISYLSVLLCLQRENDQGLWWNESSWACCKEKSHAFPGGTKHLFQLCILAQKVCSCLIVLLLVCFKFQSFKFCCIMCINVLPICLPCCQTRCINAKIGQNLQITDLMFVLHTFYALKLSLANHLLFIYFTVFTGRKGSLIKQIELAVLQREKPCFPCLSKVPLLVVSLPKKGL